MIKSEKIWDMLIIGAGPIGLACAIEAKKRELSHLIVEKGCLVNSIFHYPSNMTFFSTSDRLEIGEVPFISHGNKPTRREALEYYRRVADSWKLNIRTYEKVINVKGQPGRFKVSTTRQEYTAAQLIVASGYYDNPNLLGIPGEELDKVKHYYDEPHPYANRQVAVIGAGNSAVNVALELFRVEAKVSMIIRESELKDSIKYWVKPDIENRIKEGSIKAYFNSHLLRIMEEQIVLQTPAGQIVMDNDFVFAMTGYHPDFDLLKHIGIGLNPDDSFTPRFDPDSLQTNRPGIYLAGVVCGGMETSRFFIENSREHAHSIFDHMEKNYTFRKDP
jgi:bacillithiol disulfide reductase